MGRWGCNRKVDFASPAHEDLEGPDIGFPMYALIDFPSFLRPEIFAIDLGGFTLALRWYALAYIAGFVIGWRLIVATLRHPDWWPGGKAPMTADRSNRC